MYSLKSLINPMNKSNNKGEKIEEIKGICTVCGAKTNQIFSIAFMRRFICKQCEYLIVKQSIMDIYN